MDLLNVFEAWNREFFNGDLPEPVLRFNSRLKSTAGRFIPDPACPVIEVAEYLLRVDSSDFYIRDTVGHEMIHYYLWLSKKPYGHTVEFYRIMERMGVSRYNAVPLHRPYKHHYQCKMCNVQVSTRKVLPKAACAKCCKTHAEGNYDPRFELIKLVVAES